MGFDRRGYFYTARKVNGRVVRTYHGKGELAKLVAEEDALARADRAAAREAARETRRSRLVALDAEDSALDALIVLTDLLVRATLLAAGYHQHHRSEWRKKRGTSDDTHP
jgi:hypothetical protein